MYSSVNNHDINKSILSLTELIGIIAVFSFVLYLLFPKGSIEDFLDDQGNNTDLSINYLQSMILYHPHNIELKMILMEKYTLIGKEEKALEINQKLIDETDNKRLLTQLYKVEYLLKKNLYFKNHNPQELEHLKEKLLAYYAYTKAERDYLFFFSESTNIDYSYLRYHSLKYFMKENPEMINYELEKMALDLANQLGYKDEAYAYLQKLIKYPNVSNKLAEYFIYSLFEHEEFRQARELSIQLFSKSKTENESTKYFHLSLYALGKDKTRTQTDISQLIQDYANVKALLAPDISIILNTLLELGESKEAANFAINMFYIDPQSFNEVGIDLALKSLLYNSELKQAKILSLFANRKFKKQKYLDKSILISSWLGESKAISALNKEGYYKYKNRKYEQYFLSNENLDYNYEILGKIYKKKIQNGNYKYLDNLAKYYDYTGEINQAESYFTKISEKSSQKKALYYAIDFSYKNSHFDKGLRLYNQYVSKYGQDPKLHERSIQKLLALKRFNEAYAMTKRLNKDNFLKKKQRFTDLAWLEKDYAFLHDKFWDFEQKQMLKAQDFEQLILLERALNNGNKLKYLYQEAWYKTQNSYYLHSLLYKLLEEGKFNKFKKILNSLNKHEKNILNNNIVFQTLLANYHIKNNNISLALTSYNKIFKIDPNKITSHQSYLWFLLDNQKKHPKLIKKITKHLSYLKKYPSLRKKIGLASIVAAMNQKKHKLADYWVKQLLEKYPQNKEYKSIAIDIKNLKKEQLYVSYDKMLNEEYLSSSVNLKRKSLGSKIRIDETSFSHQWQLYQNIKSKIILKHSRYKIANKKIEAQSSFEVSLKNSKKKFLWDFHLGAVETKEQKHFLNSSLNLGYRFHNIQVNLGTKYQNKTTLTPKLEQNALENALALNIRANLTPRTSFAFLLQESHFKTFDNLEAGTAKKIQINANYILRSGYPDISFNAYASHNSFSKNIAQDFSELGISSSIGINRQNTLNSSWKPFGTVALAINNEHKLGTSLTGGISKTLKGDDSLDLFFDYYNGIGVISEPIYGVNIKYRF